MKALAQENGLADKLAAVLAQYEKDEQLEGGEEVFSLNLDAVKDAEDANQIKDKPASGRKSNEFASGRKSEVVNAPDSARSYTKAQNSGRPSMRPSQSGPVK